MSVLITLVVFKIQNIQICKLFHNYHHKQYLTFFLSGQSQTQLVKFDNEIVECFISETLPFEFMNFMNGGENDGHFRLGFYLTYSAINTKMA